MLSLELELELTILSNFQYLIWYTYYRFLYRDLVVYIAPIIRVRTFFSIDEGKSCSILRIIYFSSNGYSVNFSGVGHNKGGEASINGSFPRWPCLRLFNLRSNL